MKKNLLLWLFFSTFSINAQDFLGFVNSNYAGITGAIINPANIADNRLKVDVNLVGLNFNLANNYIGIKRGAITNYTKFDGKQDFQKSYLNDVNNGKDKAFFFSTRVALPSFMINLSPKHSVGLSINSRTYFTMDGVSEPLAKLLYSDIGRNTNYNVNDLLGINIQNKYFNANVMSWMEYGLTYARVIKNANKHFFKAGVTPKLLQGLASGYINIKNFDFRFDNNPLQIKNDSLQLLTVLKTDVGYAHSDNFDALQSGDGQINSMINPLQNFQYLGFGADFGFVYEWRPNYQNYLYDMDGEKNLLAKYENKYKLKVGLSLVDFGRIRFDKGIYSRDFTVAIDTLKYRLLDIGQYPVLDFDKIIDSLTRYKTTPNQYWMATPMALSAQIDYNIWKDLYVNLTPYVAFKMKNREAKVHDVTVISIAPRWDHRWFGVSLPVSYNTFYAKANQPIKFGAMFRLGPLAFGTNDIAAYTSGDFFGANFYFLLKVPIPYTAVRDNDHDGVRNKKDKCKDIAGVWEFEGCPDKDGDHIQDTEDRCPDVPGLKMFAGCPDTDLDSIQDSEDACPENRGLVKFKGCPDSDNDEVPDRDDECPFVFGLAEFNGCPDLDSDGVADRDDACPDVAGLKAFRGCPDRDADSIPDNDDACPEQYGPKDNRGCPWPDTDNDGIDDRQDDCPQVAGIAELRGCPPVNLPEGTTTQTVAMEVAEKKVIDKAFKSLEFATAKDIIKTGSFAGLDALAKLLLQHTTDWQIRLSGHTDNEGKAEKNMLLSEKRAKAVKNYLVKKGVNESQVIVEWFGQDKPIADNKTAAGKQKNRRVEMKIQLKEN